MPLNGRLKATTAFSVPGEHASENCKRPLEFDRTCQKQKEHRPRPLAEPPRRGNTKQHMADAPYEGRGLKCLLSCFKGGSPGSRFSAKQS